MDQNKKRLLDNPEINHNQKKICLIDDGLPCLLCVRCGKLVSNGYDTNGYYVELHTNPCMCDEKKNNDINKLF